MNRAQQIKYLHAHQFKVLPHLLEEVVKVPLVMRRDGNAVGNPDGRQQQQQQQQSVQFSYEFINYELYYSLVNHVQLFDADLV